MIQLFVFRFSHLEGRVTEDLQWFEWVSITLTKVPFIKSYIEFGAGRNHSKLVENVMRVARREAWRKERGWSNLAGRYCWLVDEPSACLLAGFATWLGRMEGSDVRYRFLFLQGWSRSMDNWCDRTKEESMMWRGWKRIDTWQGRRCVVIQVSHWLIHWEIGPTSVRCYSRRSTWSPATGSVSISG